MGGALGKAQLAQVEKLLTEKHRWQLKGNERIQVQHTVEPQHETLTVDVVDGPTLFRWEARLHGPHPAASDVLIDFLDGILDEWFKSGREAWPTLDFTPYDFAGVTVGLRGGKKRPDLEAEADAILARAGFVDEE